MISKYEPLRQFLVTAGDGLVTMRFAEVARLVGGLPPSAHRQSAHRREWWSNHPVTTAPRHAWLPAGRRVVRVDMVAEVVTFGPPGVAQDADGRTTRAIRLGRAVPATPELTVLRPDQVRSLEAFLAFRGESKELRHRIAEVERSVQGLAAGEALAAASLWGVDQRLLEGTRLAKDLAAQVDVVLHAAGILHALPHVLEPGEVVESVSLGAGNTGRPYDLETDQQVAEFKFIGWVGGAETVRQDHLLIDLFHLATSPTTKRRVMYVTGSGIPLHWLRNSKRVTRDCLARKRRVPARFDEEYGPDTYRYVRDYWAAVEHTVEMVDLAPLVPGLATIADQISKEG